MTEPERDQHRSQARHQSAKRNVAKNTERIQMVEVEIVEIIKHVPVLVSKKRSVLYLYRRILKKTEGFLNLLDVAEVTFFLTDDLIFFVALSGDEKTTAFG